MHLPPPNRLRLLTATGGPAILVLAACLSAGCGEKLLVLDEATLDERLDHVDAAVPLCESAPSGEASAARLVGEEWLVLAEELASGAGMPFPPLMPGNGSSGSCGGSLEVQYDHGNGDTDYVVTFADFCLSSADGDLVVDGTLEAFEDGKPSDFGPVVDSLELNTKGPLVITHGGETIEVTLDRARTEYGNPQAGSPGDPDAANPDVITVRSGTMVYVDHDDREDYVRDVRIERTGGTTATVTIVEGEAGTRGEGRVDIRTVEGDPLIVDIAGAAVTGGSVELLGADDTVVTLVPDPAQPGVVDITLDGEPFDRSADCTASRGPVIEAAIALLFALPIH